MTKLQMQIVINHHELRIRELEKNKADMYEMLDYLQGIFNHESKSVTILDVDKIELLLKKARGE